MAYFTGCSKDSRALASGSFGSLLAPAFSELVGDAAGRWADGAPSSSAIAGTVASAVIRPAASKQALAIKRRPAGAAERTVIRETPYGVGPELKLCSR